MDNILIYPAGGTAAMEHCINELRSMGVSVVDHPTPEVTHLLLDVPSFDASGSLRSGENLSQLLRMLPEQVTVVGGNLKHTELEEKKTMDFLKDEEYLSVNAALTADCALRVAAKQMPFAFADSSVLIIGWGRIGKCLGFLMKALGANVTIAARKDKDRAAAKSLGLHVMDTGKMAGNLQNYRLIYNTVPHLLLNKEQLSTCRNTLKIDLASAPGMDGADVIYARGLPGIMVPESSGRLIAHTFLRLTGEVSE